MAAVQHPELGEFEGRDIRHEGGAGAVPGGAAEREIVLDHPLGEGFGGDRPGIAQAERGRDAVAIRVRRGGHDAVDHGGRAAQLRRDGAAELGVAQGGEAAQHAVQGGAVVGKVVAAERREEGQPGRAAAAQSLDHEARRRARRARMGEVVQHVGVALVEFAGRGRMAIALLGDGEGDDEGLRSAHGLEQALRRFRGHEEARDGADDLQAFTRGIPHRETVEPVLGCQGIAGFGRAQGRAEDAPAPVPVRQHGVCIGGHMGAVEGADAEMDDAGGQGGAVVGGAGDRRGQAVERGVGQAGQVGQAKAPGRRSPSRVSSTVRSGSKRATRRGAEEKDAINARPAPWPVPRSGSG